MRVAAAVVLLSLATAVAAHGAPTRPSTELSITVWPEGKAGPTSQWTLRCAPVGGTLPQRAAACTALARLEAPFAPVPDDAVCTRQYGGPQEALVRGRHRGRSVWARFQRTDGCQIARWKRVGFLFPVRLG